MTKAYIFKNNKYQRRTIGGGADSGYPKELSNWHPFLANGVDAAVNWDIVNGKAKAYFFKDDQYLRWTIGEGADPNYPRPLSNWGSFFANGIDAAVNWGIINGKPKAYFFKGNQYLRYTIGEGIDSGYPKQLPNNNWGTFFDNGIDAAVNWGIVNGQPKAYFFKGNNYLRWTIFKGADSGYPKQVSNANWGSFLVNGVDAAVNWGSIQPPISVQVHKNNWEQMVRDGVDQKMYVSLVLKGPQADAAAKEMGMQGALGTMELTIIVIGVLGAIGLGVLAAVCIYGMNQGYKINADYRMSGMDPFDNRIIFELIPPA